MRQVLDYVAPRRSRRRCCILTDAIVRAKEIKIVATAPEAESQSGHLSSGSSQEQPTKQAAARSFIAVVTSIEGKRILEKHGFKIARERQQATVFRKYMLDSSILFSLRLSLQVASVATCFHNRRRRHYCLLPCAKRLQRQRTAGYAFHPPSRTAPDSNGILSDHPFWQERTYRKTDICMYRMEHHVHLVCCGIGLICRISSVDDKDNSCSDRNR